MSRKRYPSDGAPRERPTVTISIDRALLAAIDEARGPQSRSQWLESMARERVEAIEAAIASMK